jgi:hypothetical protein
LGEQLEHFALNDQIAKLEASCLTLVFGAQEQAIEEIELSLSLARR